MFIIDATYIISVFSSFFNLNIRISSCVKLMYYEKYFTEFYSAVTNQNKNLVK